VKPSEGGRRFVFSRHGRIAEPHVVIVPGRGALTANYNVDTAAIIDVPYTGGGWNNFAARACDALGLRGATMQIFTETLFERALEKPVVVYVGNAQELLNDGAEDLLRYVLLWEQFAFDRRDEACPMFLALQIPERERG
jgi:hypothetical protein